MLVTTSIIESGIDIPTANTLIVERADMLGLAQLYQIRGRIGRSDEHAYAYLLYPSEELLTSDAAARLTTLSDHTDLGAGFKIAMADLEIRGAGNLLGDEQSGHVAAVGFEMYAQMLEEAVHELQGEQAALIGAGARRRAGHRLRAARLHRLRGEQDRRPPAHRARPQPARARRRARRSSPTASGRRRSRWRTCSRCRRSSSRRPSCRPPPSPCRGGRLQLDGLDLDDDWAARLRAAHERVVYFKQKRSLSAHREAVGEGVLGWVEATLDAILDARVSRDRSSTPGRESL